MNAAERHVSALYLAAVDAIRAETPRADVRRAIDAGDFDGALQAIRWEAGFNVLRRGLPTAIRSHIEDAGHETASALPLVRKASPARVYDVYDDAVVDWARQHAAELIEEFGQSSMRAVRTLIVENLTGELTTKQLVDSIMDLGLGLTTRDAVAVQNRRRVLQDTTTLTDAQIEDRVRRYAQKLLRQRAKNIARTEVTRARMFGKLSAARQSGLRVVKMWKAHADACDECAELDGDEVDMDETFDNGEDGPPGHPNCRCDLVFITERK